MGACLFLPEACAGHACQVADLAMQPQALREAQALAEAWVQDQAEAEALGQTRLAHAAQGAALDALGLLEAMACLGAVVLADAQVQALACAVDAVAACSVDAVVAFAVDAVVAFAVEAAVADAAGHVEEWDLSKG